MSKTTGNRVSDDHRGRAGKTKIRPAQVFPRLLIDITPLRESVAFRRLLIGSALSGIGGQMTNCAYHRRQMVAGANVVCRSVALRPG